MKKNLSRRNFIIDSFKTLGLFFFGAVCGPFLAAACRKKSTSLEDVSVATKSSNAETCQGLEALSEQDKNIRASLKYVDSTPLADKTCDNCKLYTLPKGGSFCGGCQVVPGPIHPKGYCTAWIKQM